MLSLVTIDFDILPHQLLPATKEHVRVEFDRDDDYIKGAIGRAIGEVESVTNLTINPASFSWEPTYCYGQRYPIEVPKTPLRNLMSVDAAGNQTPVAVTMYENTAFLPDRYHGHGHKYLIEAGYSDIIQIPPAVVNAILMLTGTLYENRESLQFGSMNELPDMSRRLLSGLWRPSC